MSLQSRRTHNLGVSGLPTTLALQSTSSEKDIFVFFDLFIHMRTHTFALCFYDDEPFLFVLFLSCGILAGGRTCWVLVLVLIHKIQMVGACFIPVT
jgi:hypothetical protein